MSHLILTAQRRTPTPQQQLRDARDRMIAAIRGDVPWAEYAKARDRYMALWERELEAVGG